MLVHTMSPDEVEALTERLRAGRAALMAAPLGAMQRVVELSSGRRGWLAECLGRPLPDGGGLTTVEVVWDDGAESSAYDPRDADIDSIEEIDGVTFVGRWGR